MTLPCSECALKAAGDRADEGFSQDFGGEDGWPASTIAWLVPEARRLVAARPRRPLELSAQHLAEQMTRRDYTPGHIAHIPRELLERPGLGFYFSTVEGPEGIENRHLFLLDGAHRAAWAMGEGRPFSVYVLTEAEQLSCIVSYVVDGQELGPEAVMLAPGVGTTDREAGILSRSSRCTSWLRGRWARVRG